MQQSSWEVCPPMFQTQLDMAERYVCSQSAIKGEKGNKYEMPSIAPTEYILAFTHDYMGNSPIIFY